jgi:hypothetical protein
MIQVVEPGMGLASGDVDRRLSAFHGRGQTAKNPEDCNERLAMSIRAVGR